MKRRHAFLAPAAAIAGVVIVITAVGLLIRDQPAPSIVANPETMTTTLTQETTTAVATTTVAVGPVLSAPPSEPHIQVGLNNATLILSLAGDLIGHVQPPLVGPEFYQSRQTRLTDEAIAFVDVPEGCQVEAVLEAVSTWRVVCRQLTDNPDPTIGILSANGMVEVIGRIPPGPAGSTTIGHWGDVFDRGDGVLLAQFSGECEVPHAMLLAYDIDGSRELLYPIRDFPIWGRIVQQR